METLAVIRGSGVADTARWQGCLSTVTSDLLGRAARSSYDRARVPVSRPRSVGQAAAAFSLVYAMDANPDSLPPCSSLKQVFDGERATYCGGCRSSSRCSWHTVLLHIYLWAQRPDSARRNGSCMGFGDGQERIRLCCQEKRSGKGRKVPKRNDGSQLVTAIRTMEVAECPPLGTSTRGTTRGGRLRRPFMRFWYWCQQWYFDPTIAKHHENWIKTMKSQRRHHRKDLRRG